jgi:hypothetical protein
VRVLVRVMSALERKWKMFFWIAASQSKPVECATAQCLVQRCLSTWLAPCHKTHLFSTSINSEGFPK